MKPAAVLETVLYAADLEAAETFYTTVLGLSVYGKVPGRHVFFKLGEQMLLIFNPRVTVEPPRPNAKLPVPPHGATGEGHVCFAATATEIDVWKRRLQDQGIEIEADFEWPSGGRSIYFRDPAGNCLEFAAPPTWGFEE